MWNFIVSYPLLWFVATILSVGYVARNQLREDGKVSLTHGSFSRASKMAMLVFWPSLFCLGVSVMLMFLYHLEGS